MKKIFLGIIGTAVSLLLLVNQAKPDGLLHVYFLNVGQGDAILIRSPQGENILVDGGPGNAVLSELKDTLPYFDRTIDYIILTHPDQDHLEGIIYVLKNYPVKHVIFTGASKTGWLYTSFAQILQRKNIPIEIADKNSDIHLPDETLVDILFPFKQMAGQPQSENLCIVAKVVYGENEILLTGDAEATEEQELANSGDNLSADVLKVGHHGSQTATTEEFLDKVDPKIAVISVGKDNKFHHPHAPVLNRLKDHSIKIYRTDLQGRIELIFDKQKMTGVNTTS